MKLADGSDVKDLNVGDVIYNVVNGNKYTIRCLRLASGFLILCNDVIGACCSIDVSKASRNPPHPHREVIIAWANGAEVETRSRGSERWQKVTAPTFLMDYDYRILQPKNSEAEKLKAKIAKLQAKLDELEGKV